jgi:hypothetical protein
MLRHVSYKFLVLNLTAQLLRLYLSKARVHTLLTLQTPSQYIQVPAHFSLFGRTGIRSPDRPARSQSLYRLSYPAHTCNINQTKVPTYVT